LPCRFGGEEWLEDFVFDGIGDAGAVVGNFYFNFVSKVFGGDGNFGFNSNYVRYFGKEFLNGLR
jgi:hypothetical protein